MVRHFLFIATLALAVFVLAACSNPTQETLEEILLANKKTMGGESSIEAIATLSAFASVKGPRSDYNTIVVSSQGGDVRFTRDYGDRVTDLGIRDGQVWYVDPETGEVKEGPGTYEFFIRGHEFHFDALFLEKRYMGLSLAGQMPFRDCSCTAIHMSDAAGNEVYVFFEPATSRLRGFRKYREDEENTIPMDFVYEDWAPLDDLTLPRKVTIYDGDDVYIYSFINILVNQAEDADFLP